MKKSFYQIVACGLLLAVCVCCNGPDPEETPETRLAVIKLTQEMQELVWVTPIVDSVTEDYSKGNPSTLHYGDGLALCNPTPTDTIGAEFAQETFGLLGTNPYILLGNGYVVIDWKWAYFLPLSGVFRNVVYRSSPNSRNVYSTNPWLNNGNLANEEYYLLSLPWQELTNLNGIWKKGEGTKIETPDVRYIKLADLETYAQIPTGYRAIYKKYNTSNDLFSVINLYKRDIEQFEAYVTEYDQLQSLYIKALNQMITNNDFDKWTQQRK